MFSHKLDSIINRVNLFSNIISNLQSELILNSHDQFNHVQRVQFQVIYKVSSRSNLYDKPFYLNTQPTFVASTASKFFTTSNIREVTSSLGKKVYKSTKIMLSNLRTKETHSHSISKCRSSLSKESVHFQIK